jgi:hypothetical protein
LAREADGTGGGRDVLHVVLIGELIEHVFQHALERKGRWQGV